MNSDTSLLRKSEAAKRLCVSERMVDRLAKAGKLNPVRFGPKSIRFRAIEIAEMAENGLAAQSR